jgi:P pilus assembly chaperone PapD
MMKFPVRALSLALLTFSVSISAAANVLISGTRVVFPAQSPEVTLRLTNQNSKPALVESWIDRGDEHSTPDKVDTPFLITPPLFRIEPHRDQSLRIIYTQEELPADRESLFWLNVLEVPPKPSGSDTAGRNYLQLAIRSRLKLFYRPTGLAGDPAKAPGQMSFKPVADDQGVALAVHNPTPYYVTIAKARVDVRGQTYATDPGMVAPFGDLRLPVRGLHGTTSAGTQVRYDCINDFGALTPFTAALGK